MTMATVADLLRVEPLPVDQVRAMAHARDVVANVKSQGFADKYALGREDRRLAQHRDAYLAEIAVCLALGCPWHPIILGPDYRRGHKAADVGRLVEVRSSIRRDRGLRTPLRERYRRVTYVHVHVVFPVCWIVGWLTWQELTVDRYRTKDAQGFNGWEAPWTDLHPIAELPRDLVE